MLPVMRTAFNAYFRGEVRGLENIPDGPSLLVGNHSGGTYIADTFVFSQRFYEHFGPDRRFHQLAHSLAARHPLMGLIRHWGTVEANHENARRAFKKGAPVLVYPGGDYETYRPTTHSDQIEFAGRKGWVKLALREGVPIVPVVSIGGQETALFLTRGERLARLLALDRIFRLKVLPISIALPWGLNIGDMLGHFPLPAKITVEVLKPIDLRSEFGDEPDVDEVYEEVTRRMQAALTSLDQQRSLPFFG
jgi:1-acyl-sn-glycerol-3-phosphate acyltransferase